MVEQTISDEQSRTLARWLKESEDARRLYVRYLGLSASLHHYAGRMPAEAVGHPRPADDPGSPAPLAPGSRWEGRRTFSFRTRTVAALSLCLVLALAAGFWLSWRPAGTTPADRPVVEAVVGELEIDANGTTQRVSAANLSVGDRVRVPSNAIATLRYPDASFIELRSDTTVKLGEAQGDGAAKVLVLEQGTLFAEVQPQRQSMVILTPNARATVLGTRFLLSATADETRLDVQRGKVQLAPLSDQQSVDVVGGHVALATSASPSLQVTRAASGSENRVQNPGFEVEFKDGQPLHWRDRRLATLDRNVFHTGAASLKVTGPSPFKYVWQSIALEPDARYRLSAWIKTENVTSKEGVRPRYAQIEPVTIVWWSPPIRGTRDWVLWSTEFKTPPDYCCGRLDLTWELNDGATVWFDDVELVRIDAAADAHR